VTQAQASGFALIEQSASGLGNSFAGAAASAEDASTIYYNPAGMSLLGSGTQFSAGLALIDISAKFSNSGSTASGAGFAIPTGQRPLGGEGGNAGGTSAVPNFYVATDIAPKWKIGVGVSVPFGLKTEYDPDWMGRFQAIKSSLQTTNINPSVSYKLSDTASLGFGVSYQKVDAELTNAVNYVVATAGSPPPLGPGVAVGIPAANAEGTVKVKGDDAAWGYNFGAIFQLAPETRVGISYRSSIKYHITGTVTFDNVPPGLSGAFANGNVSLDLKMPDMASLALTHQLNEKMMLLADVTWTGWSKIQQLTVVRDTGATLTSTPEGFRDTLRFGVGANYRSSDAWTLKAGLAYDQTPVNDVDRTARLPDGDRTWISFGGQYRLSKAGTLDIGFAHIFVKNVSINQNAGQPTLNGQLVGTYKSDINILGAQFAYQF
jgi:long-chain fatty acid transport protein